MSSGESTELKGVNLSYRYGSNTLFLNLHFSFENGIIGIVGANGSGKSTLLSILSGCNEPSQGEILINKRSLYRHPELKNQIGFVSANPFLYPYLTLYENLQLVSMIRKVSKKSLSHYISRVLYQCGLQDYQKVLFGKLSDGIKKRAMLASALIHQPSILILDEPCTGLCPKQRQQLWDLCQQLTKENKLIIFSTHHPQEISHLCTKMYALKEGGLQLYSNIGDFSQTRIERKTDDTGKVILESSL